MHYPLWECVENLGGLLIDRSTAERDERVARLDVDEFTHYVHITETQNSSNIHIQRMGRVERTDSTEPRITDRSQQLRSSGGIVEIFRTPDHAIIEDGGAYRREDVNRWDAFMGSVRIRHDANWSVPDPELTLVINNRGSIVGYP
jgi:hypothetical protein